MDTVATRAEPSLIAQTETVTDAPTSTEPPVLRLRLQKPKSDKKVNFEEGTVDNEHMGKKKSKCCCIYRKPIAFGESSSEDDEECEHCFGHPEKRKKNHKPKDDNDDHANGSNPSDKSELIAG